MVSDGQSAVGQVVLVTGSLSLHTLHVAVHPEMLIGTSVLSL